MSPVRLRPDNFTPPARTPWGGRAILEIKRDLCATGAVAADKAAWPVVGESWEVSVEPDFPSALAGGGTLADAIAADPAAWVGGRAAAEHGGNALLVKLLDAAEHLSVQVHPTDDYPGLAPGEGGKPESWYVVAARPGAGLYLGLREGAGREQVAAALAAGADLTPLLQFAPVAPGDFFRIDAGTVHAIGAGVTLVEPQRVAPRARGVTYRFSDWNRRYDAGGRPDPAGRPRALHVDHALAVTAWDAPRGEAFVERVRRRAGAPDPAAPARRDPLCHTPFLTVDRLAGTGALDVPACGELAGLVVVDGAIEIEAGGAPLALARGESAAIPAAAGALRAHLRGAHAILARAR